MNGARDVLTAATTGRSHPLLVCYLPVGDPEASVATPALYADHGVDVIEAGVPGEEARLDGPVVRRSMESALRAGTHSRAGAEVLAAQLADAGGPPAVWMSYRADPDPAYLGMVAESGVGGVLLPGSDPHQLLTRAGAHDLHVIPFLDHQPTADQVAGARRATSYAMVAAAPGVTGERAAVGADNADLLADLRRRGISAPLVLGFGISRGDHARAALGLGADGVVVGSACLRAARTGVGALRRLLAELRRALDG